MDQRDQLIGDWGPAEVGLIVSIVSEGDLTRDDTWGLRGRVVSVNHFAESDRTKKLTRVTLSIGPEYKQTVEITVPSNHRVSKGRRG